jgi:L-malate glycosyltransferase
MKILWLAGYPYNRLEPELILSKPVKKLTGGTWLINLSSELAKIKDVDLHILTVTPNISHHQEFVKEDITYHFVKDNFPFSNKGYPPYLPLNKITWYYTLRKKVNRVIKKINPDIIHSHGTEEAYSYIGVNNSVPCIVSIQGIVSELFKIMPFDLSFLFQIPIEKSTLRKASNVGCRTEWDKQLVKKINPASNIHYLPEAIKYIFFEKDRNPKDNTILYVATLIERKGIEILIHSLIPVRKQFADIKLRIVGSGDLKYVNYLKHLVDDLDLKDNITWLGSLPSENIAEELSTATVYVLPTFMDNSPNSLAEAMAVGVPCISTFAGGVPSMINNGYNGLLVEPKNVEDLAGKIILLLKDKELRNELSNKAKKTAKERNYPPFVAKTTLDVYKHITNLK